MQGAGYMEPRKIIQSATDILHTAEPTCEPASPNNIAQEYMLCVRKPVSRRPCLEYLGFRVVIDIRLELGYHIEFVSSSRGDFVHHRSETRNVELD